MTALSVIEDLYILEEIPIGLVIVFPPAVINQFGFEDMEKRLRHRVIPTISFSTHTLYKPAFLEHLGKPRASILDALIRVDQEPLGWLPSVTRVLQGLKPPPHDSASDSRSIPLFYENTNPEKSSNTTSP